MNGTQHDKMVKSAVNYYQNNGYSGIRADHIGYPNTPDQIAGNIPDITCYNGNIFCISEVETAESYNTPKTLDQLKTFSSAAISDNSHFHVVVPVSVLEDAKNSARMNGIKVDLWLHDTTC